MTCSICERRLLAKGYCGRHYNAWRKYGDPNVRVMAQRGEPLRWLSENSAAQTDLCILWPFKSRYRNGYGSVFKDGHLTGAHRVMCLLVHGQPPSKRHQTAHSCGNRLCVNPKHLRWATQRENESDKKYHGSSSRGENNGCNKLSRDDVHQIYARKGSSTQHAIAVEFGISRESVCSIHNHKTWGWLTSAGAAE